MHQTQLRVNSLYFILFVDINNHLGAGKLAKGCLQSVESGIQTHNTQLFMQEKAHICSALLRIRLVHNSYLLQHQTCYKIFLVKPSKTHSPPHLLLSFNLRAHWRCVSDAVSSRSSLTSYSECLRRLNALPLIFRRSSR